MSKLLVINDSFSCAPGTQYTLVDDFNCECSKGTLYVTEPGSAGKAVGKDSQVFALVPGAKAIRAHEDAVVMAAVEGAFTQDEVAAKKKPSPPPARQAAPSGVSRSAGSLGLLSNMSFKADTPEAQKHHGF